MSLFCISLRWSYNLAYKWAEKETKTTVVCLLIRRMIFLVTGKRRKVNFLKYENKGNI